MRAALFSELPQEFSLLSHIIHQMGYDVLHFHDIHKMVESWTEHPLELVLLSIPRGFSLDDILLERLRALTSVPIAMIVEGLGETEQLGLYDAGIDLVQTRPYSLLLFTAQLKVLIRRSANLPYFSLPLLTRGEVQLDPESHSVKVGDEPEKHLTHLEFRLLFTLMTHDNKVMPSDRIVTAVWGYSGESNRDLVRGLVQRLRAKIETDPQNPVYIITEPGIGYSFTSR